MNRRIFMKAFSALCSGLIVPQEISDFLKPSKVQLVVPSKRIYKDYGIVVSYFDDAIGKWMSSSKCTFKNHLSIFEGNLDQRCALDNYYNEEFVAKLATNYEFDRLVALDKAKISDPALLRADRIFENDYRDIANHNKSRARIKLFRKGSHFVISKRT